MVCLWCIAVIPHTDEHIGDSSGSNLSLLSPSSLVLGTSYSDQFSAPSGEFSSDKELSFLPMESWGEMAAMPNGFDWVSSIHSIFAIGTSLIST